MVSQITDFNRKKQLDVDSVAGTPTVDKATPIIVTGGDDSTTGNGDIVIDWTNVSDDRAELLEDWEDGDIQGWTGNTGSLTNQQSTVISGSDTGELNSSNEIVDVTSPSTTASGDLDLIEFQVRIDNQTSDASENVQYTLQDSNGNDLIAIDFIQNGNIEARDSNTTVASLGSWSANTNYDVEVLLNSSSGTFKVFIDGTEEGSGNLVNNTAFDRLNWASVTNSTGLTVNAYLDNLDVRYSARQDIAVYDQNGNLLDYEIEDLDTTAETATLWCYNSWVRDGSTQAQIAYGDNSDNTDNSNTTGTWGNTGQNAEQVYHLDETSGSAIDSTSNNNDSTSTTGTTYNVDSIFDGGRGFDALDDLIDSGLDVQDGTDYTVVAWAKQTTGQSSGDNHAVFGSQNPSSNDQTVLWIDDSNGNFKFRHYNSSSNLDISGPSVSTGTNYMAAVTFDSSAGSWELFTDASSSGTVSGTESTYGITFGVGARNRDDGSVPQSMGGDVSEYRVYGDIKSQTWMQADYDASPKAGQVFFSQQAAENTTQTQPKTPVTQDGFEDGDFTNNPEWTASGTVNVQGTTVKNGSFAAEITSNSSLELDRGTSTSISDGDVFHAWIRKTGEGDASAEELYSLANEQGGSPADEVLFYDGGSSAVVAARDSNGNVIDSYSFTVDFPANEWRLIELEFDTANNQVFARLFDSSETFIEESDAVSYSGTTNFQYIESNNNSSDITYYIDDVSYKSQQLLNIVTGQASGTASFTGNATATNKIFARASGTSTLNGDATATQTIIARAQANGSASLTGSADAYKRISVTANGSGTLNGDAQASFGNIASARASGSASFTGTATGTKTIQPVANGSASFTGDASGSIKISIVAEGEASFNGSAEGTAIRIINAKASGSASLTGTAISTIPEVFRDTTLELDIDKSQSKTLSGDIDK